MTHQRTLQLSGTGSIPPGWSGWQRATRFMPSQLPRTSRKRDESPAYCEQSAEPTAWAQIGVTSFW